LSLSELGAVSAHVASPGSGERVAKESGLFFVLAHWVSVVSEARNCWPMACTTMAPPQGQVFVNGDTPRSHFGQTQPRGAGAAGRFDSGA
jgi:hypothetical protein